MKKTRIAELEANGLLRPPVAPLPEDRLRQRHDVNADVVAALLEERANGR